MFAKLQSGYKDRVFWRLNTVYTNTKTTSGDAYDVTGKVVDLAGLRSMINAMPSGSLKSQYNLAVGALEAAVPLDQPNDLQPGLGTPPGIKARAGNAGTLALSVGVYLDESKHWATEALLLGLPLSVSVYGDGVTPMGRPNGLNGQKIITTKLLPPTVLLGRYFGEQSSTIRPYLGIGAMYAVFFDTKATDTLNSYQGGQNPGDTKVNIKNAFGVGPFLGLQASISDGWKIGLSVGQVRLKTRATLETRNTVITTQSAVTHDYGPNIDEAIGVGEGIAALNPSRYPNGFTTKLLGDYANYKATGAIPTASSTPAATLGTFVRKQNTTLDNTIMMLSVGREF
ncbi:MAG TPA: OmpW family outer membrane protein [Aquabacterium sp.]|nr:OmpW family outer membrane protein [Aquabacterium sp.]